MATPDSLIPPTFGRQKQTSDPQLLRCDGEPLAVCARRLGVTPMRLYWRKKRLAKVTVAPTLASLSLVPATIVPAEPSAAITIRLSNGIAVKLASDSGSPSLVAAIVGELNKASSCS